MSDLIEPALFDRKLTHIYFRDGFGGVGKIDDMSLANGNTSFDIDPDETDVTDAATLIPVGARFTLEGYDTIYTVTGANGNQSYTLTISMATGGNYDLTIDDQAIDDISHSSNAAAIQSAINAVLGPNSVTVTGSGPYVIEFTGDEWKNKAVTASIDDMDLTGMGGESGTLVELQPGGITHSLTFAPALKTSELPSTGDVITFLPQQLEVELGEGNFTWTEKKEREYRRSRGRLNRVRNGDEQPVELNIDFDWTVLRTGTGEVITPYDAIKGEGGAAGWYASSGNPCDDYCVDVVMVYEPDCNSAVPETTIFEEFRYDSIDGDVEAATLSVKGQCNRTEPTITRG